MQRLLCSFLAITTLALVAGSAQAAEKLSYLFPAPDTLPAFIPFQLAKAKGYYVTEGLDVSFVTSKGGADAAKQVAIRNADLGGGLGDSPIIVRSNGVPVKGVALLGGGGLTQIIVRKDRGINSLKDLRGKKIGVVSFQNTNFYALLPVLAHHGIARSEVSIQAVGLAGVIQLMVSGDLDAISNVPENATQIEAAGVAVQTFPVQDIFPAMAQAILASDAFIAERPNAVRAFVRATLRSLRDCMADPVAAAKAYVAALPQYAGKESFYEDVIRRYRDVVYATAKPEDLGKFDPARLEQAQKFYLDNGVITKAGPIADLYTNQFVQ